MNIAKKITNYLSHNSKTLFIFFCLLLFIHIIFTFCGFYNNDDIIYAKYAAIIANGGKLNSSFADHYSLRWVCIDVTALFYKLFGINAIASSLFSFSCFITTAIVIFKLIRNEDFLIQLLTCILFFWNYTVIFYSHRLLPDAGVCLFVLLAYYCYNKQRFYPLQSHVKNGILFALSVFLAALTKETIFITLPLWVYLFAVDIFHKRNLSFWLWSALTLLLLAFMYGLYFKVSTNDWLYRYHILQQVNASYGDGSGKLSIMETVKRIGYQLWQSFLLNGDMEYLIPAIIGIIYFRSVFKDEKIKHIAVCFIILLLSADLMTFSPTMYAPLLPDPRHFIFIIPFAVITAAFIVTAYTREPSRYFLLLVAYLVADVFLCFLKIGNTKYLYFFITVVLVLRWIHFTYFKRNSKIYTYYVLFAAVMCANYIYDFIRPQYSFYFDQKEVVQGYFNNAEHIANVFTGDPQTAAMSEYFIGFRNKNVKFESLASSNAFSHENNSESYLLINGGYDSYFKNKTDSLLKDKYIASNFKELKKVNDAVLYEVKNPQVLTIFKPFSTNNYQWR